MSTLQEVLAVLLGAESEAKRIVGDSKNEAESMLQTAQEKFSSERTSRMAAARGQAKDLMEAALNSGKNRIRADREPRQGGARAYAEALRGERRHGHRLDSIRNSRRLRF